MSKIIDSLKPLAIVINRVENNKIEAGNGTWQAAKNLGWTQIAAVMVDDDPMTATGYGIADNRLGDMSQWDGATLAILLDGIDDPEIPTGFVDGELDELIDSMDDWSAYLQSALEITADQAGVAVEAGYKRTGKNDGISGVILLGQKQFGKELVMRLKDNGQDLPGEVEFWGNLLARLVTGQFDYITAPPPSKRFDFHLATTLAKIVGQVLDIEFRRLFTNDKPSGKKTYLPDKLTEEKIYGYLVEPSGKNILVVDDVIYTRKTAMACINAARGDSLRFVWLYGA